ncbi:MAG: transposase [Bryobacterales bacterium]|nr:transposase [Opitutaceae bacterium]MCZ2154835.1 transposase [Bryobacterales bacterium]
MHSPEFKTRVALEILMGIEPMHVIASKYQVHPVQVTEWKKELLAGLPEVFERKNKRKPVAFGCPADPTSWV